MADIAFIVAGGAGLHAASEDVAPIEALVTMIAALAVRRATSVGVTPLSAGVTLIELPADCATLAFARLAG